MENKYFEELLQEYAGNVVIMVDKSGYKYIYKIYSKIQRHYWDSSTGVEYNGYDYHDHDLMFNRDNCITIYKVMDLTEEGFKSCYISAEDITAITLYSWQYY